MLAKCLLFKGWWKAGVSKFFLINSQTVNISGFVGHMGSVTTASSAVIVGIGKHKEWTWLCSNKILHTKTNRKT